MTTVAELMLCGGWQIHKSANKFASGPCQPIYINRDGGRRT